MNIHTQKTPDGKWQAIDADQYEPGQPIGYGDTDEEAEADLRYLLQDRQNEKLLKLQHVTRELQSLRSA